MNHKTNQSVYFEIKSRKDEKKWKEFLRQYFPNHYAIGLLEEDLIVEEKCYCRPSRIISVGTHGFGWLSLTCLYYGGPKLYVHVNDFEEFKQTNIYKEIVDNGPMLGEGEPQVIRCKL